MKSRQFLKTILISLLGHVTFFSIFSFSFGARIPNAGNSSVIFWGQLLGNSQVAKPSISNRINEKAQIWRKIDTLEPDTKDSDSRPTISFLWEKPHSGITANVEKTPFRENIKPLPTFARAKGPAIIFHPLLPYGFTLYFRDRQVAHVELAFRAFPQDQKKSIIVKRIISSGNLEVDLLSIRYIERYLFMQQADFTSPDWNTVKIDLSAKE
ncbi:MAG: hypothetical protein A3K83_05230 [Omnitrophica WOR_2 bacterium RBG_13_44_8b]|nr:MAG: hypothetical protein A3K83_05230 [Omnitrophica WOR_2 bacterium RBG_13_44_8b]